jgi:hypothetical protein
MRRKRLIFALLICGLLGIGCAMVGPIMSNVETPKYEGTVLKDNIELRTYAPMIIASVEIKGNRKDAIGEGFRVLADYIFGNNVLDQNISMTAPVQQQSSKKISMTAPVQQQQNNNLWEVSFVMPATFTLETIPKPINQDVKLNKIPAEKYITIEFSGTNSNDNIGEHENILFNYIRQKQIKVTGKPKYAFYNPPWTLPVMRRNEIMIQLLDD